MADYNQFDAIRLLRTSNIKWLSGERGSAPDPNGTWTIVGFIGADAIAAKDDALVKVPLSDVTRVGVFSTDHLMKQLSDIRKKDGIIDVAEYLMHTIKCNYEQAVELLNRYQFPVRVNEKIHKDKIVAKMKEITINNDELIGD